jgi:hypothetical protein
VCLAVNERAQCLRASAPRAPWVLAALALAVLALVMLTGCGRTHSARSEWIIHTRLAFLSRDLQRERPAVAREQFRLVFPYVAGDLYGPPTTGDFIHPVLGADNALEIDLNRSHQALLASLEPTDFRLSFLHIDPPQARIARLTPLMLQADGIDPVGELEWFDLDSRRVLLLLYLDRPASITGRTTAGNRQLRYAIRSDAADYVWVARQSNAGEDVYAVIPMPVRLVLAARPLAGPHGSE